MALALVPVGRSGLRITRLGLGSWVFGGSNWSHGWGPQHDRVSLATMRRALEHGINWIDTAPAYGLGRAERIVGRLLRDVPRVERPLVFTKCGLVWDESRPLAVPRRLSTPESIRRECEASLKRLGVECIDLYQLHWPDETGLVEDAWATLLSLVQEGKVRSAGVSNFETDLLTRCHAIGPIDSLQPRFSLLDRSAHRQVAWCAARGTAVLCYSPLQSGLLTDTFTRERLATLSHDDWRRRSPDFRPGDVRRSLQLRDALRPLARRHETSVAAIAIAWVLAWPGVTAAIVGARRAPQVDDWIAAGSVQLAADDLEEISSALQLHGDNAGPIGPRELVPPSPASSTSSAE